MKTWIVECTTLNGEVRRFHFEGVTLKHCRMAVFAEMGRHNIAQVKLSNGERERVYDHFPLHFDQPKNNKGRLRSRLSWLSSAALFSSRDHAAQEVKTVLADHGLTLAPITLEGKEGRKVTGVLDGAEVIDYILFEWKQTEQGNYDFTIHLV